MSGIQNVIFDIGNVLVKWDPYQAMTDLFEDRGAMMRALQEIGFFVWNHEQDRGRSWEEGLAWAEQNRPEHLEIFQAYAGNIAKTLQEPVDGSAELVQRLLARGVRVFGLSNAPLMAFDTMLETAPVLSKMEDVLVSAREFMVKPDAEIFELLLQRNGLAASECLFIDDTAVNCEAAERIGIRAHRFTVAAQLEAVLDELDLL
ncbi:HAD family hydrolase [Kiloniella sp. b19]|uniref:HAD family hydrolase n=1 Tax=Kiloniella sp. GXU_MW_B19 TaxID=3141326 RepID=UPI0031D75AA3